MRQGDVAAAQAALAAAKDVSAGLSEREASHIGFFDLVFAGRTEAAIAALYPHLAAWPRDALVVSVAANPNGVIGGSGRIGQKRQIAELMDSLASHYGDDFWFTSYHAMALIEWAAPGGPNEDRAIAGGKPEQCAWRTWFRPCSLPGGGPVGPRRLLIVARHISGDRFSRASKLASVACEIRPAIGHRRSGSIDAIA
jgi:hypothetical protein